jgi:hypothetical protein
MDDFQLNQGGQLGGLLRAPIDKFRRLRNLSKFGGEDESVFWGAQRHQLRSAGAGLKP